MKTSDFDFSLPPELIAQRPTEKREDARLLIVDRATKTWKHQQIPDLLDLFGSDDVLVFNQSKVIPARILLEGGREIFLSERMKQSETSEIWKCLVRKGKAFLGGQEIHFSDGSWAKVLSLDENGLREIEFSFSSSFSDFLDAYGEIPLPPYIERKADEEDRVRYQNIFAENNGSVAAPTAGLHFTEDFLKALEQKGVTYYFVTLHVGLGTFLPVKVDTVENHKMHAEYYEIDTKIADALNAAKKSGKKVTAVGSTALRTLESAFSSKKNCLLPGSEKTRLFVYPPAEFSVVDHFLTNFHLPKSTLLMLTSAFASPGKTDGRELLFRVYEEAVSEQYRFFSYGDATMWW